MATKLRHDAFPAARRRIEICFLLGVLLLVAVSAGSQERKLKVYISADMEGIGGVSTWQVQAAPGAPEYEKSRRLMTLEVNSAVSGAFDAGATDVLVSDSHWSAQNIDIEALDPRARLVRAFPRPLEMMQGIDNTFDAVVFIGYHASEGTPSAILSHTISSARILELKLNDTAVPEAGLNAAIAGEVGVPVVFLSGDQATGRQARELLGPIGTVAVKQATGFYSATMLNPGECQRLIHEGVKRAVVGRKEMKPYRLTHPVKLELTFKNIVDAELVSCLPGIERPRGSTIVFKARDMIEASKFLAAILGMNTFPRNAPDSEPKR
jgi:D-amino peptidase